MKTSGFKGETRLNSGKLTVIEQGLLFLTQKELVPLPLTGHISLVFLNTDNSVQEFRLTKLN